MANCKIRKQRLPADTASGNDRSPGSACRQGFRRGKRSMVRAVSIRCSAVFARTAYAGYGGTRLRCQGTNHASGGPAVLSHEPDGEYAEAVYDLRHEQEAGGGY